MDCIPIRRMRKLTLKPGPKPGEDGFILLGVIILVALFVIAMSVAAPQIAKSIQRDRDLETMQRGKQYIRAIQLYYRKFHAYPPNLQALVKTNDIRFLRKKYIDPTTGKDDWKPILFGQNKTPMAMGFFGQPLGGTGGNVLAGTGPSGGNGTSSGSPFESGIGTGLDSMNSGTTSATPTGSNTTGGTSGSSANNSNGNSGSSTDNGFPSGQTFGGGGIIGVSPASAKQSILVYKKMDHYNQWEFLYSPLQDQKIISSGNGAATSSETTTNSTGNGTSSTTTGTGTSTTNTGTPTTLPSNPQQPF